MFIQGLTLLYRAITIRPIGLQPHAIWTAHYTALRVSRSEPAAAMVSNPVDLTVMSDDEANKIIDRGKDHGFEQIIKMTGNFGVESYFHPDVYQNSRLTR